MNNFSLFSRRRVPNTCSIVHGRRVPTRCVHALLKTSRQVGDWRIIDNTDESVMMSCVICLVVFAAVLKCCHWCS